MLRFCSLLRYRFYAFLLFLCLGLFFNSQAKAYQNFDSIDLNNCNELYNYGYNDLLVSDAYDSSIQVFHQVLACAQNNADSLYVGHAYYGLGAAYRQKGDFNQSLVFYQKAADVYQSQPNNQLALAYAYHEIGILSGKVDLLESSLQYLNKALLLFEQYQDTEQIANAYNSLAAVYERKQLYDSAEGFFLESLEIRNNFLAGEGAGYIYNNLGMLYQETNDYGKAERYFLKSIAFKNDRNDLRGLIKSNNELGNLYLKLKQPDKAKPYLDFSLLKAESIDSKKDVYDAYLYLSDYYNQKEDYKKALEYSDLYISISDELYSLEAQTSTVANQLDFELRNSKKESERSKAIADNALKELGRQEQLSIVTLLVAFLLVVLLGFIYRSYLIKKRANQRIQTLMRELHHRVKNNLQIISDLLSLQSERLPDELARKAVKAGEDRVRAMALIHKDLYHEDGLKEVNMFSYLEKLTLNLVASYGYDDKQVKVNFTVNDLEIDVDKAIPIGVIANELISNSFKYAFPDHPNPKLQVSLLTRSNDELELMICDNGIGLGPNTSVKDATSFGLKLVHMLTKQLKGKLTVLNENGLKYTLSFPA